MNCASPARIPLTGSIGGPDSGYVESGGTGTVFSGVENLTGDVGNEDTFTFWAGGDLSGRIDGNTGGFDSLVIDDWFSGPANMRYSASGADSGVLDYGDKTIEFAGLEPITDNSVGKTRIFDATAADDIIRLREDPTTLRSDHRELEWQLREHQFRCVRIPAVQSLSMRLAATTRSGLSLCRAIPAA